MTACQYNNVLISFFVKVWQKNNFSAILIHYPILMNFVPLQLGQGGNVSVSSSSTTIVPEAIHLYVPLPGFSPVVYIAFPPFISFFYIKKLNAKSHIIII